MIKIIIDDKKLSLIKSKHENWFKNNIYPDIKERYQFLKKNSKTSKKSRVLERYLELLEKIIDIGPSYCIQEELFFKEYSEKKIKFLSLMNKKKGQEKSHLEKAINQCFTSPITKEKLSSIIKEIRKKKISREKKIEELIFQTKSYDNLNQVKLKQLIEKFPTANPEKNIINLDKANLSILEINSFYLKNLFNYDDKFANIDNERKLGWGRHQLISMMEIEVCPYCQRNFISNYMENNGQQKKFSKTTADLDHFYSQSQFPYLSLSLYNFIPSCQICNSRFKKDKETYSKVLNPLKEGFDDNNVKFETSETIIDSLLGVSDDFFIRFKHESNKKIENTINMFGLDKVYKTTHNLYIKNMLENIEKKPAVFIESLVKDIFDNPDISKDVMIDHMKELVKEPYKHKINSKEPLAKLTKDILEEFKILP